MLTPNVVRTSILGDCSKITLQDETGAYSGSNTTGYRAELQVTGIGSMTGSGLAIAFSINGTGHNLTEGIDWNVGGDVSSTVDNMITAIETVTGASALKVDTDTIYLFPTSSSYTLSDVAINNTTFGLRINLKYRDDLALVLFLSLEKSTGYETIAIDSYDYFAANQWQVSIIEDGYYTIYSVLVPRFDSSKTYVLNNIVYNDGDSKFYQCTVASSTSISLPDWKVVSTREDFESATNSFDKTVDDVIICFSNQCAAKANLKFIPHGQENSVAKQNYEKIRNYLEGATYAAGMEDYENAQIIIERIQELCNDIDCQCGSTSSCNC